MSSTRDGIRVYTSFQSILTGNNFTSNQENGINLYDSSNITVSLNRVDSNSLEGITLSLTTETTVYHNSIAGNVEQAYDGLPLQNTWDEGYPKGGNYWSDYLGPDNCSGAEQNVCTGADGIGDQVYNVTSDGQNHSQDRYPLMAPFHDIVLPTWTAGSLIASGVGAYGLILSWTQALDDHMVAGYRVFWDGVLVANLPGTMRSFTVTGLAPSTLYTFKVEAGENPTTGVKTVRLSQSQPYPWVVGPGGGFFGLSPYIPRLMVASIAIIVIATIVSLRRSRNR